MKKIKVAITGGIGSGKSIVADLFHKEGFPVIRADDIAKDLMKKDPAIRKKIIAEFGEQSFTVDGPNTAYLSEHVFSDIEKVEKINSIMHPATIRNIEQETRKLFKDFDIIFVESALVFEAKLRKMFDYIVLVTADVRIRVERIILRDKTSSEKVLERMKFQIEDEKKIQLCDFVIDNNGTPSELVNKCKFVLQMLKSFVE
jgi:dephospho-CoA kinase